jgi:acetylornithine/N-succinyldiaminopimelate aminotransferase
MVGVEINGKASEIQKEVLKKGLLVLTAGTDNVVRILPPLIITKKELEKGLNIIYEAIDNM